MTPIKIIDSSLNLLAVLTNVVSPLVSEEINREHTASFKTVIDNDKSNYVTYQNIAEIESNYFNIAFTKNHHNADGTLTIDVECEHVSYDLLGDENDPADTMIVDYYADAGTPETLMTNLLAGTGFTVGAVEFTDPETLAINERVSKKGILLTLAAQVGGELKFDKYEVSLLTRRGADNGVSFRYRRNIISMSKIVDNRNRVSGLPTVTYDTDVVELEFAEGHGVDDHYELGDTVYLFDDQLGIANLPVRIIKESHDPMQRMKGNVTISNATDAFIGDISNTVSNLQQTSVQKDASYYGSRIGPTIGFESTRADNLARAFFNADAFKMQARAAAIDEWLDKVYYDAANGEYTLDGRFILKYLGKLLAEIYKDEYGGRMKLYDADGNLNIIMGVEAGTGTNTGGTLIFLKDVPEGEDYRDYRRVEIGIVKATDSGVINLRDTNNKARVSIEADSAIGPYIAVRDTNEVIKTFLTVSKLDLGKLCVDTEDLTLGVPAFVVKTAAGVVKSYLAESSGQINNKEIATQEYVDQAIADHVAAYVHTPV